MKKFSKEAVLRRIASAGAVILAAGVLAACSSGSSDTSSTTAAETVTAETVAAAEETAEIAAEAVETAERQPLTIAATTDPGGLGPYGVNRTGRQVVRSALYEPLFWMDEDKNLCPVIGKSYEYKGDGVYDVEIFDYVYDSAGEHMTASDIAFSVEKMSEDGHLGDFLGSLTDCYAVDDYIVEFVFGDESIGNFETLVTYLYCITEASWEASGDDMVENPVGTGLYTCYNYILGSEYDFTVRDDYWQTDPQYLCAKNTATVDPLIFKVINDASTIAIALENGEIDFSVNIGEADRGNFIDDDANAREGYTIKQVPNASLIRISFNCSELSPCQDINLRKAIATCIDSAACAYSAQLNYGHMATNLINPSYLDATDALLVREDYYDYDVEKAKEYLEQSSFNGETIRVLVQPNDNCTSSAVLIQAYARELGIDMELMEYDNAVFGDYLHSNDGKDYDMVIFGLNSTYGYTWKGLAELDIGSFNNGLNQLAIYDDTLQTLYNAAASSTTNSEETVSELIDYVTDQCYEYALFYYDTYYVGLDKVKQITTGAGNDECIYNAFIVEP